MNDMTEQDQQTTASKAKAAASKARAQSRKVRATMRDHGITTGFANGKVYIWADGAPPEAVEEVREAIRKGLI